MTAPHGLVGSEWVARPWSWKGDVQAAIVAALWGDRWTIHRAANTATRESGKVIEAERDGTTLWITVKGFPAGTTKTRPATQARHWFAKAIFDVVLWRGEDPAARIAVGLPRHPTYERLAERVAWLQEAEDFTYVWVTEDGSTWG